MCNISDHLQTLPRMNTPDLLRAVQPRISMADLTTCSICLEDYVSPRALNCIHTFCEKCLEDCIEKDPQDKCEKITCPLCRQVTVLSRGGVKQLPLNNFVTRKPQQAGKMADATGARSALGGGACGSCKLAEGAAVHCEDCALDLCSRCQDIHGNLPALQDHKLAPVQASAEDGAKIEEAAKCAIHTNHTLGLYCLDCKTPLCIKCVPAHKLHIMEDIEDKVEVSLVITCTLKDTRYALDEVLDRLKTHIPGTANPTLEIARTLANLTIENIESHEIHRREEAGSSSIVGQSAGAMQGVDNDSKASLHRSKTEPGRSEAKPAAACQESVETVNVPREGAVSVAPDVLHIPIQDVKCREQTYWNPNANDGTDRKTFVYTTDKYCNERGCWDGCRSLALTTGPDSTQVCVLGIYRSLAKAFSIEKEYSIPCTSVAGFAYGSKPFIVSDSVAEKLHFPEPGRLDHIKSHTIEKCKPRQLAYIGVFNGCLAVCCAADNCVKILNSKLECTYQLKGDLGNGLHLVDPTYVAVWGKVGGMFFLVVSDTGTGSVLAFLLEKNTKTGNIVGAKLQWVWKHFNKPGCLCTEGDSIYVSDTQGKKCFLYKITVSSLSSFKISRHLISDGKPELAPVSIAPAASCPGRVLVAMAGGSIMLLEF